MRQVAVVDAHGSVAVHTGDGCIAYAGHETGDGFACQANMMARATVPDAMAAAFERPRGALAERLLAALDAAEAEGGDVRGRQSAALLVVPAEGEPWRRAVDLRVEDHPEPLGELRRLLPLNEAYDARRPGRHAARRGARSPRPPRYYERASAAGAGPTTSCCSGPASAWPRPATSRAAPTVSARGHRRPPRLARAARPPATGARPAAPRRSRAALRGGDRLTAALPRSPGVFFGYIDTGIFRSSAVRDDPVLLVDVSGRVALAGRRALGAADVAEGQVLGEDLHRRGDMWARAPMLRGSSWTHTTSAGSGTSRRARGSGPPGTDRAARRAPIATPSLPSRVAVADEVVVDLAGAEDEPGDLVDVDPRLAEHRDRTASRRGARSGWSPAAGAAATSGS